MAEMVTFASNGGRSQGYLSLPESGQGPGVIVVQEWWGLESGIKEMADRLAAAGFVALAPDLYHGELAGHTEMDKAASLMTAMPPDRAARDMSGAVDYLADHPATTGERIGVLGFCMGGMLSFVLAALRPDKIKAAGVTRVTGSVAGDPSRYGDEWFAPTVTKLTNGQYSMSAGGALISAFGARQ